MKRFTVRPLFVVLAILVTITVWATFHTYKWHYGLAYYFGLVEITPTPTLNIRNAKFIAHAGGDIDAIRYTNSREAFLNAIKQGFEFIEVDLRLTLDGHYFAAHYVDDFNSMTGYPWQWLIPPTTSQVRKRKILDRYTPLLLSDIADILKTNENVMLDIDKGESYETMFHEISMPDRVIIETNTASRYIAARVAGFPYVAYAGTDAEVIEKLGIKILVVNRHIDPNNPYIQEFCNKGGVLLITGFNQAKDVPAQYLKLNALFYVGNK